MGNKKKVFKIYDEFIGKEGDFIATILLLNKNVMISGENIEIYL